MKKYIIAALLINATALAQTRYYFTIDVDQKAQAFDMQPQHENLTATEIISPILKHQNNLHKIITHEGHQITISIPGPLVAMNLNLEKENGRYTITDTDDIIIKHFNSLNCLLLKNGISFKNLKNLESLLHKDLRRGINFYSSQNGDMKYTGTPTELIELSGGPFSWIEVKLNQEQLLGVSATIQSEDGPKKRLYAYKDNTWIGLVP